VVFSTGMCGNPESLTVPSDAGQILVLAYPHIGNYGVPPRSRDEFGLPEWFESEKIQVSALVISSLSADVSHWSAERALDDWLRKENVPGLFGVDTRAVAKRLRDSGAMLGKILPSGLDIAWRDPNTSNLVAEVSVREPVSSATDGPRVVLWDSGARASTVSALGRAGA